MTRWVVEHLGPDVPMHFTAFHPDFKMLDTPRDAAGDADAAPVRSRSTNGVRYAYTGNVHDRGGGSTRCPGCGALVIERDWYRARRVRSDRRRPLPLVRHAAARPLRRARGHVGRAPAAGAARRARSAADDGAPAAVAGMFYPGRSARARGDASTRCSPPRRPRARCRAEGDRRTARRIRVLRPDRRDRVRDAASRAADEITRGRAARARAPCRARRSRASVASTRSARRSATSRSTPSAAQSSSASRTSSSTIVPTPGTQHRGPAAVPPARAARRSRSCRSSSAGTHAGHGRRACSTRCGAVPRPWCVVSTDLSHYEDHDSARVPRSERPRERSSRRRIDEIGPRDACGVVPAARPARGRARTSSSCPRCSTCARPATPRARAIVSSATARSRSRGADR